jgi:hypothetical protein
MEIVRFSFVAGAGRSILWYVTSLISSVAEIHVIGKFYDHRGHPMHAQVWVILIGAFLL